MPVPDTRPVLVDRPLVMLRPLPVPRPLVMVRPLSMVRPFTPSRSSDTTPAPGSGSGMQAPPPLNARASTPTTSPGTPRATNIIFLKAVIMPTNNGTDNLYVFDITYLSPLPVGPLVVDGATFPLPGSQRR